ncbi:hypothetical protein CHS0354_027356 [Potamilus streckersoni]|uniref:Large ribosomal subunit protein uL22c n=1 Tax=Potamilus streckersoni TaxID=2493646 RepID=A0AAE0VZP6_9BIVA|nr:hypothetical protein CHS0354_027356 [Potamilus streckersoni]
MQKPAKKETALAIARGVNVRIAPRKARLVADYIRGKNVRHVYAFLESYRRKANPIVLNILKSAVANAVSKNANLDEDKLYVSEAFVDEGMTLKRMRPRAMGRGIGKIEIERADKNLKVTMHVARPGIIIGRKGEEAEKLKKQLASLTSQTLILNIKEIKKVDTDAQIIAFNIAQQIQRRVAFRRVIKRSMQSAMRFNIKGCKIMISGRLNGAEIARTEWIREGTYSSAHPEN